MWIIGIEHIHNCFIVDTTLKPQQCSVPRTNVKVVFPHESTTCVVKGLPVHRECRWQMVQGGNVQDHGFGVPFFTVHILIVRVVITGKSVIGTVATKVNANGSDFRRCSLPLLFFQLNKRMLSAPKTTTAKHKVVPVGWWSKDDVKEEEKWDVGSH